MERLPQELLTAILENLYDPNCLSRSSLVCRSWLPTSQRLLFHTIRFDFNNYGLGHAPTSSRLYQIFLSSPHISDYVKELEVRTIDTSTEEALPLVLHQLNNVEKLNLNLYDLPWFGFTLDFRHAIYRLLHLPSMKSALLAEVGFGNIQELASVLYHTRYLTHLTLSEISFSQVSKEYLMQGDGEEREDGHEHNVADMLKERHLSYLCLYRVRGFPIFVDWLVGPSSNLDVSHIHTLHISIYPWNGAAINQLLRAVGSSLKNFHISLPDRQESLHVLSDINTKFNPNIRLLDLTDFYMDRTAMPQLPWLLQFLSTTNISNRVEAIRLEINFDYPRESSTDLSPWNLSPWNEVDCILAGPHYVFLKKLDLCVLTTRRRELYQKLLDNFPLLRARGILAQS